MKNEFHDRRNRWSGFKGRSLITPVLVLSMIISAPFFSNAANDVPVDAAANTASGKFNPPDEGCSLTVKVNNPDGEFNDLLGMDLAIDLYQLAPAKANDGSDGYFFDWEKSLYRDLENPLYRDLEKGYEDLNDIFSKEPEKTPDDSGGVTDLSGDALHKLSQKAAGLVLNDDNDNADTAVVRKPFKTGYGRPIGEKGITIDKLDAGLYLLVVRSSDADSDYVTTRMDGETENIVTIASSATNSYTFLPQLVSLPKRGDIIGTTNTADEAAWNYNVEIYLKPEKGNGSLIIEKTLKSYYDNLKLATFVFHVVATSPNGSITYYDDYVSIDFDGPGTKSVEINDIPIGAKVTVEEVYDGSCYKLLGDQKIEKTISGDKESFIFTFVNEYDWTQTGGHGINNHFTYTGNGDDANSGWDWEDPTKAGSGSQDDKEE